jgi:hypothetical protein
MVGTGIEESFSLRGRTPDYIQRSLRALQEVDLWDLLSLNPADSNATNLGFITRRIRAMMAFFHPDKAEIAKQKLQNKPLPSTHDHWQELHDLKEVLEFSKESAEKLLVALQKRVASVPARWTSTWNFDAISENGSSSPFKPIPSFDDAGGDKSSPQPSRKRAPAESPNRENKRRSPRNGLESLANLRRLANNSSDGRVAVATISQPKRPRQQLGPKAWVVIATKPSSGTVRYKVANVNLHGEDIGHWDWKNARAVATTAADIKAAGRWVGPFAKWGGEAYVKRYFAYRSEHGCDPDETDSLEGEF